jgi:hypothetical protein
MKLCIDCADEIPEDRVRLDPGTMRCATCQEMHEVDRYERQILQNKLKSNKTGNEKGSATLPTEKLPNFLFALYAIIKKISMLTGLVLGVEKLDT